MSASNKETPRPRLSLNNLEKIDSIVAAGPQEKFVTDFRRLSIVSESSANIINNIRELKNKTGEEIYGRLGLYKEENEIIKIIVFLDSMKYFSL